MHNINFQPHFSFRCDWHWLPGRPTSPNSQRATKQPNWRHRQRRRYAAAAAAAEVDRATSTTPMTLTTPTWWWCWAPPRSSAGCRRRPWIRRPSWWAAGRWRRIAGRWASTASTPRWPSPSRSGSGTPSCRVRKATGPTTSTMEATAGTMWTSYRHLRTVRKPEGMAACVNWTPATGDRRATRRRIRRPGRRPPSGESTDERDGGGVRRGMLLDVARD